MCSIIDSFLLLHFVCSEIWLPDVMKKKELFLKSLFSSSEPHFNNLAMFYETYSLVLLDKKTSSLQQILLTFLFPRKPGNLKLHI